MMLMWALGGCESMQFYSQAIAGQASLLVARQPIAELLAAPDTDATLRGQLVETQRILEFARHRLALEPGNQFTSYVEIDRPYLVWNVFATREFSTQPSQWCYPIVGCASYRGYFHEKAARRLAVRLRASGHDVSVGGVVAYSTLGWFNDPVLSTFVVWPREDVAGLIFHELTHRKIFIRGDVAFNEAIATFVERQGLSEWLAATGDAPASAVAAARWQRTDKLANLLLIWRDDLQRLYDALDASMAARLLKAELLAEIGRCYATYARALGAPRPLKGQRPIDNADLLSVATYQEHVAGFAGLFIASNADWRQFFAGASELGRYSAAQRKSQLAALAVAHAPVDARSGHAGIVCQKLTFEPAG